MSDQVTATKRKGYELEADLMPIIEGKIVLPNSKLVDRDVGAAVIFYSKMHCGAALLDPHKKIWNARFFLDYGQGGQLYGSGLVAWTEWKDGANRAVARTFAICEHKKITAPGANPSRGWHPGSCEKCGLDMTVDSGD